MKSIFFLIPILMGFASILGMEEKWVQLGDPIDLPDHVDPVWRIKDQVLALNVKAKDPETSKSFEQLQEAALKNHVPYILLGLYAGDEYATFVDGSYLPELYKPWKDSKYSPGEVEIFVVGDDGIFTNLVGLAKDEKLFKDNLKKTNIITAKEEVNQDLQKPGHGHLLIANTLKEMETQKKTAPLYAQMDFLAEELEAASKEAQIDEIEKEMDALIAQKKSIEESEGIPTPQMRQWFEWAVQYLPKGSPEYEQATKELAAINVKLGKVIPPKEPEKPKEEPEVDQKILMQSLQNLTRSLEQLTAQLK